MELENKVCLITGALSGLGYAITKRFLEEGAIVVAVDYNENNKSVLDELGYDESRLVFCKANVSSDADTKAMVDFAVEKFGKLDVAIANAGISGPATLLTESIETWHKVLSVDLDGVYLTDHYAALQMEKQPTGGSIINTSSVGGLVGFDDGYSYSAAKAAVVNMTRASVVGLAPKKIRVNAIAPGFINTPLLGTLPQAVQDSMIAKEPIGRLAEPEEVANAYVFLASDKASYITGITLPVDGGFTAV